MTEWNLLHAMEFAKPEEIAAALGERTEETYRTEEVPVMKQKTEKQPSALWQFVLKGGIAAACIASAAMLIHMIPKDNGTYTQPSGSAEIAVIPADPVQEESAAQTEFTQTTETDAAAVTTTALETVSTALTSITYGAAYADIDTEAVRAYFAPVYALGTDVSAYQKGDIDMNGKVDLRDAAVCRFAESWKILQSNARFRETHTGWQENYLTDDQISLGDVSKEKEYDFQPVNSVDTSVINWYVYFNDFLHQPMTMEQAAAYRPDDLDAVPEGWDEFLEQFHVKEHEAEFARLVFPVWQSSTLTQPET